MKNRPDILLVSSMSLFPIIYAFWLRLRCGAKVILEVRDIWPLTAIELGGYGWRNSFILIMSLIEIIAKLYCNVLIFVLSDFWKYIKNVTGI